ncbi:MAG: tetratricopeptide repeat protein [Nitrospirae bacterium]|nr:tetratricopeptide repeat protein [Nitrospirota bacterium]
MSPITHRVALPILLSTCLLLFPFVPSLLAETPNEQDDAVRALSNLREHVRTAPQSIDHRLKLAEALYRIGDLDTAIDECRVALALKPDHALAHLQLGIALMAKQDWRPALTELRDAARLNPALTQAHYNLGTAYYTTGNLKGAIESYRQALTLQPSLLDARYRLALALKFNHRDQESIQFMKEAAAGGVPQAQYALGQAYRTGQGVEKNGALTIYWWSKSVEFGHQPAAASLSLLRQLALSTVQPEQSRLETQKAFQAYRETLWENFPGLARSGNETLGTTLLKQNRADKAVSVLLQECYALSDVALAELARIYETGWEPQLPPFDKNILACIETTAGDSFMPAKKILARIYGKGLGVKQDRQKMELTLKGLPKDEIKEVLNQLTPAP